VRLLDVDWGGDDQRELHEALDRWFREHGIADAVFAVEVDDDGYFAVVNDEVFEQHWGRPIGL
jgi:hypothetical protein